MADGIASRFDGVSYAGDSERLLEAVLGMPSTTTRTRPGARAGGGLTVTVGGGPEAATIAPGGGVLTDSSAGVGSWLFVIPTAVTKTLATRPSVGQSRIDEVVARINTATEEVEVVVKTGTASAGTPTAPTVSIGELQLAELVVPATGTVTVQKPARRTVALGGILPVASQADRDAIEVIYDGLMVYREDTDVYEARINGGFVKVLTAAASGDATLTDVTSFGTNWGHGSGSEKTQVERNAGMVTLYLSATKSSTASPGDTVCTLPSGFRPKRLVRQVGRVGASTPPFTISTAGVVTLDSVGSSNGILGIVTFPAA